VNGICGCGLPARCCQPAVACSVIYADLRGELNTHLALQALFVQSSPVCKPLLQAFPFPSTGESDTTPFFRPACLFTAHVGSGSSPISCGVLLPPPLSQAFPILVAWCTPPLPPEPLQSTRLIYSSGKDSLPPIFGTQCTPPSFPRVFIVLIAYCSVSLFSPGGGWSVQGAMLLWPRLVCGSTAVPLSSPCPHLPKPSGCGQLAAQGPSWFLCLM
jgi:hypothetical protein